MDLLASFFNQQFAATDLAYIGLLVVLEGVLSIDNALVLGLLAKRLPKHQQPRALTYGLVGAFVFRLIAIALASLLLKWWIVKLLGGAYLIYVAVNHFFFDKHHEDDHGLAHAHGEAMSPEQELAHEREEIASHSPFPVPAAIVPHARKHAKFWP